MASPHVANNRAVRSGYLVLGLLCVGLGYIGVVTPGMPGTVFFIIALWAFERSSPRLELWLRQNRLIGPTLEEWRRNKSIAPRTKAVIILMTWAGIGITMFVVPKLLVRVILAITASSITAYILTRKSSASS